MSQDSQALEEGLLFCGGTGLPVHSFLLIHRFKRSPAVLQYYVHEREMCDFVYTYISVKQAEENQASAKRQQL